MTTTGTEIRTQDEVERARERLDRALEERDRLRVAYEDAVGTSCELRAYVRLRATSEQVRACDKWLRWADSDEHLLAPRGDDRSMAALLSL